MAKGVNYYDGAQWVETDVKSQTKITPIYRHTGSEWVQIYPARLTIDGFEDGDTAEYSDSGPTAFSTTTSAVYEGTYAGESSGDGTNSSRHISQSGLPNYPVAGDKFEGRVYITGENAPILFGWQDADNRYQIEPFAGGSEFRLYVREAGSFTKLASKSVTIPTGEWLRIVVDWGGGGDITCTLYDAAGSQLAQVSGTDETFVNGGFGWTTGTTSNSIYYDGAEITFPAHERTLSTSVPSDISNPIIEPASYSDDRLRAPHVLQYGTGYKMHFEANSSGGTNGIYEADSSDGANWNVNTSPVLTPGTGYDWISMPSVLEFNGTWYMWYGRRDSSSGDWEIAYASSSSVDGPWSKEGTAITAEGTGWEESQVRGPDVIEVNGQLRMYYMGHNTVSGGRWQVGLATTEDPTTWNKSSANPLVEYKAGTFYSTDVANPGVVEVDGSYWLFFEGLSGDAPPAKIGHVRSDDGVNWEYPGTGPIIEPTSGWRAYQVFDAAPVFRGDELLVYFCGMDSSGGTQQIGATRVDR